MESGETGRRTVAELVAARWGDQRPGLWFEERVVSHHAVAAGAAARAALLADLLPPRAEPHVGVLLDNTPEFPLWLGAAALAGAAVAGTNPTRRGAELARDILHTECPVLVTERAHLPLLDGLELPGVRVLVTGTPEYEALLAPYADAVPDAARATPAHRLLLYFTSGSTGAPKAAICSQGRLSAAGHSLAGQFGVRPDDVHYICMPMFHSNAVIADWAPALAAGAGWRSGGGSRRPGSWLTCAGTGRRTSPTSAGRCSTSWPPSRAPTTGTTRCASVSARRRAVYAVPDPVAGDHVMATLAGDFDPLGFAGFLLAQPDLGTKMAPRFVRVVERIPVTATGAAIRCGGGHRGSTRTAG